jgi:hypothetical protein
MKKRKAQKFKLVISTGKGKKLFEWPVVFDNHFTCAFIQNLIDEGRLKV